jgi:hypothetical protein
MQVSYRSEHTQVINFGYYIYYFHPQESWEFTFNGRGRYPIYQGFIPLLAVSIYCGIIAMVSYLPIPCSLQ